MSRPTFAKDTISCQTAVVENTESPALGQIKPALEELPAIIREKRFVVGA